MGDVEMALKGKEPQKKGVLKKPPINLNKKYKDKKLIGREPLKQKSKRTTRNA